MQTPNEQILTRTKCWLTDCGFEFFVNTNNNDAFVVKKNGCTLIWKPLEYGLVIFDKFVSHVLHKNITPPQVAVILRNL